MPKEKPKRMMLFCEPCSYKQIIEPGQTPNLIEIKTSPVPGGAPEINPDTKKLAAKPLTEQSRKFKCPCCGRGVVLKELQQAYANVLKDLDEKRERERLEADKKKRLEDGKPLEKKEEPEFLG